LYIAMDAVAALRYDGYSYLDQTISELSAVGAPTRSMWLPLGLAYAVLTLAGAAGIWFAASGSRRTRVVAVCITAVGVLGLVAWPFAPMHQRAVLAAGGGTFADTMHLALGGADTLLFVLAMVFGAGVFGRRFRLLSFAMLAAVLIAGSLTSMQAGAVADNGDTPWIGVTERIGVFGSMIWVAIFALALLRRQRSLEEAHHVTA
ncbi:MAG TPA: DUF998 domain-containing protein, partial [Dehalococcoidia bacterium]